MHIKDGIYSPFKQLLSLKGRSLNEDEINNIVTATMKEIQACILTPIKEEFVHQMKKLLDYNHVKMSAAILILRNDLTRRQNHYLDHNYLFDWLELLLKQYGEEQFNYKLTTFGDVSQKLSIGLEFRAMMEGTVIQIIELIQIYNAYGSPSMITHDKNVKCCEYSKPKYIINIDISLFID